jgi:tRNA pseudouridine55 synthase
MDGVLVIDKPPGVTSHDVVAVARRSLREKRIGHTGTLDPLATGVLPLACGRATRLVRFLASADKAYDAVIRFGLTTDSYDITGNETARSGLLPTRDAVERGLATLRGEYDQVPPAYSAKRVGSRRAYELARRDEPVELRAVPVRVARADLIDFTGSAATVAITCSAGFYVRTFAHTLGELTGTGACLEALRRIRSGDFGVEGAVPLDEVAARPESAAARIIPMEQLLPGLPVVRLTVEGRRRVTHGREIEPVHLTEGEGGTAAAGTPALGRGAIGAPEEDWVRLIDPGGSLVAMATRDASGSLHPAVVLI